MSTPANFQRLINLLHFARVVDAGSFAEAARRAGTTTSALSKAVSRFEQTHGVRLLHRSTHALSLTPEGERLLEGTRDLLREAERLEATLDHAAASGSGGRVRLSAPAPLIRARLAGQVPTLLRANPDIELELKIDDGTLDLAAEAIDIAIRYGPLAGQPGLVATPLGSFPWILCATRRYVELMGAPLSPADLVDHKQIGFREPRAGRLMAWQFTNPADGSPIRHLPRPRLVVEDVGAIWSLMRLGVGLAWLPAWVGLKDLREGRVVELLRDWRVAETPIHAVRLERRQTPRRIRSLLDGLQTVASQWSYSDREAFHEVRTKHGD
ncbi:LysR family transcriptional regulator [Sphingomonas prati]|uniref:DNA-binding transcriptional LysR family regulator n=1 Tax=Sphingomonas prati TaxID=1843237 RepID=A0A7W9BS04_9SPHN|nr:LysR family transcriptional regulator [Sphingomonas prati]MBB5729066.1 DNA-binding transcriptional LysR family regulator [Sphingomonas prati]GGE85360.1 transcriptional regulator [Sphingomonas prati]